MRLAIRAFALIMVSVAMSGCGEGNVNPDSATPSPDAAKAAVAKMPTLQPPGKAAAKP